MDGFRTKTVDFCRENAGFLCSHERLYCSCLRPLPEFLAEQHTVVVHRVQVEKMSLSSFKFIVFSKKNSRKPLESGFSKRI